MKGESSSSKCTPAHLVQDLWVTMLEDFSPPVVRPPISWPYLVKSDAFNSFNIFDIEDIKTETYNIFIDSSLMSDRKINSSG